MTFPATAPLPAPNPAHQLHRLTCADAPAMVALTELAFPGFFRHRTCLMGNYYGIFQAEANGRQLIAMGGERLCFSSEPCDENPLGHHYRELSGICTHPAHRGQGHAATIMAQLLQDHRSANQLSFLHTGTANPAAALYHRLGLLTTRTIHLHRLLRTP